MNKANPSTVVALHDEIESLRQQLAATLADALAAIKVKDGALRLYKSALTADDVAGVALAATADLDGLILCEKKPVARKISYGSLVFLEGYAELSEGTPLYRAWEPKT